MTARPALTFLQALGLCTLLVVACTVGCEPPPSASADPAASGATTTPADAATAGTSDPAARKLLDTMAETYAKARSYEDIGEIMVEAGQGGQKHNLPPTGFSVSFERPNRLRLHAFETAVVSDGELLRATTPDVEQILTLPAPPELQMASIVGDRHLAESLRGGLPVTLPVLRLLLGDKELPGFGPKDTVKLLPEAKLKDETLSRVEATTDAGKAVYWISPETHLLRRLEFPTDEILKQQGGGMESLKIWADFNSARVGEEIAREAFEFEAPDNVQLVKRLVPPPPAPPAGLLGQVVGEFSFDDLQDGGVVDLESTKGKVTVLDFWATWCGWCFQGFPSLQKVHEKYAANDKVQILAVDTDEEGITDADVKQAFADKQLKLHIVRDRKEFSRSAFEVEGLPTVVVLDGTGRVQYVHVGYDANSEEHLSAVIDDLLAGKDVAGEMLEQHEKQRSQYEQELNDALIGTTSTVEVPQATIAERSAPEHVKLEPLWTASRVSWPGNLLTIAGGEGEDPTIYVVSGSKRVVQLSATGEPVKTFELDLPEEVAVSTLRTAVDGAGKRYYVAFASTQQQLYLYDDQWQRLLAFPDSQHSGLSDVQFADLNGDGELELVIGYWGVVGVQAASLSGQRLWSNRQIVNVARLAVGESGGKQQLLCVNGRDFITPIDAAGTLLPEIAVGGSRLFALYADKLGGDIPQWCALSTGAVGSVTVLGLGKDGAIDWEYALPRGIHNQPVELVTVGQYRTADGETRGAWVVAAPDGSVHLLRGDGTLIDHFNTGDELTGVALAVLDGKTVLMVSSPKVLEAWQVEGIE